MGSWKKHFETIVWAMSIALISLIFIYSSFATKEYVDIKHANVVETLRDIKVTLEKIDQRTYDMSKGRH